MSQGYDRYASNRHRDGQYTNNRHGNSYRDSTYGRRNRAYDRRDDDDYDDFSETTTGKMVGKLSNLYNRSRQAVADNKAAKKAVTCNKCEFDSCEKSGSYYDIKTRKEVTF